MQRHIHSLIVMISVFCAVFQSGTLAAEEIVGKGSTVTVEYTLALDDGTVVDSNLGEDALTFKHGEGTILPALENALTGAAPGDTMEITVAPEDGFGPVNPEAIQEVSLDKLPEDARKAGAILIISNEEGQQQTISIREIREGNAVIDMNHPLAGQTLHYNITILSVE